MPETSAQKLSIDTPIIDTNSPTYLRAELQNLKVEWV
jgi:hypothetical protein